MDNMDTIKKKIARKKRESFLKTLAETSTVSRAARVAGIKRSTLYKWRKEDETFALAWDEALEEGIDKLEAEAVRRAKDGTQEPVYYQGKQVGTIQRYSDTLLIFLLKKLRPEKFGDGIRRTQKPSSSADSSHIDYSQLSDEQLARIASGETLQSVTAN
jgi:hypothetical protein